MKEFINQIKNPMESITNRWDHKKIDFSGLEDKPYNLKEKYDYR